MTDFKAKLAEEKLAKVMLDAEEDSVLGIGQCLEHRQTYEEQDEQRKHWLRHKARAIRKHCGLEAE